MDLPSYAELPEIDGVRVAWGLWGEDDRLGCLNLLTPEKAVRAAGLVHTGAVFPLDAALDEFDPPLFTRPALEHEAVGWPSGTSFDDRITMFNTQSSSQWDGFMHMADPGLGFYNAHPAEALGIEAWSARGIVTRGVLADVGRWLDGEGRPPDPSSRAIIEPSDLMATLDTQEIEVEPGDILLIRTGWLGWYRSLDGRARGQVDHMSGLPGLAATTETAEALWNLHVAAVAADNPAFEVFPHEEGHLHWDLLPRLGIPIGELWDLDALAEGCAADGVYEFLLTSAPLHLRGGVASPPNALAVK